MGRNGHDVGMQDYVVVTNDRAGRAADARVAEARDELARSGAVEVLQLGGPRTLDGVLDELGGRTLVVAGGDGTLHRVVQRLCDRDELGRTTLGLLPLGTGNDLARCVGIPLTPVGSAATIRFGRVAPLDLVQDEDGGVVLNAAHTGISSQASAQATALKPFLRRAAYPVAALIAGTRRDGVSLCVTVDGAVLVAGELLLVAVMNGTSIGGGSEIAPKANPTDGVVDVVAVVDPGRLGRVEVVRALRAGRLAELDGVTMSTGREVSITGAPSRHNVDGEVGDEVTERRYRVLPGALRLVAPATTQIG